MENLVVKRNQKVSIDIPNDLAFSILSKMSIKSLKRFECVCKSWTLLFQNPYFIGLFSKNFLCHNLSYYDDSSLLELQTGPIDSEDYKYVLYSLSGERFQNKTKLDWINPFQEENPEFDVVGSGSINGILCVVSYSEPNNRVVLWNPTIGEFKVIPNSLRECVRYVDVEITRYGFGYDSTRDDYKVIRQIMYNPNSDTESESGSDDQSLEDISYDLFWEIYSLQSNSWRKLESDFVPHNYKDDGICLDGACHWLGEDGYDSDEDNRVYLLSFDLSNEAFLITPIPLECVTCYLWNDLVVLNGFITFISPSPENETFHISILGKLGVKQSWIKLYIISSLPCIERPIKDGNKRYIPFTVHQKVLVGIELSTLVVEKLGFIGYRFWSRTIIYKGSNIPIGGINK